MSDKKSIQTIGNSLATQGNISTFFKVYKNQLEKALPRHITADRMTRVFCTALLKNPKLGECTTISLFNACVELSEMGLEPNGRDAHLIAYGKTLTVIPDYKGLIKLIRQSGDVSQLVAVNVYDQEDYTYREGIDRTVIHTPLPCSERGNKIIATYSVCVFRDGNSDFEWLWRDDIIAIRDNTPAWKSGKDKAMAFWRDHEAAMFKKTAIRAFSKRLPISGEKQDRFMKAAEYDSEPINITPMQEDKEPGDPGSGTDPNLWKQGAEEGKTPPMFTKIGWRSKGSKKELVSVAMDDGTIVLKYLEPHGVPGKKVPQADFGDESQMMDYLMNNSAFEQMTPGEEE